MVDIFLTQEAESQLIEVPPEKQRILLKSLNELRDKKSFSEFLIKSRPDVYSRSVDEYQIFYIKDYNKSKPIVAVLGIESEQKIKSTIQNERRLPVNTTSVSQQYSRLPPLKFGIVVSFIILASFFIAFVSNKEKFFDTVFLIFLEKHIIKNISASEPQNISPSAPRPLGAPSYEPIPNPNEYFKNKLVLVESKSNLLELLKSAKINKAAKLSFVPGYSIILYSGVYPDRNSSIIGYYPSGTVVTTNRVVKENDEGNLWLWVEIAGNYGWINLDLSQE